MNLQVHQAVTICESDTRVICHPRRRLAGDAHAVAVNPTLSVHPEGGSCCGGAHLSGLSPREREAFFHIVTGKTIREVANTMNVRCKTAENYRCSVLTKLRVRNAVQAVHFAVCHGLLVPRAAASAHVE